jgi:surface polysaccharide O-acyltransferase-like enzyme
MSSVSAAKPDRLFWPDLIRVIAVAAVIVLHVAAVPVAHFASTPRDIWWWAHGFDSLARPCIPLFVILSGALHLTRPRWNASNFVSRRIVGVAIPFIVWSALYSGWDYVLHGNSSSLTDFFRHLASGMTDPAYSHLWFLPLILSLYTLVPIFRVYSLNSSLSNQIYFIILWLTVTIAMPLLESFSGFHLGYLISPVSGYVGYFVTGATLFLFLPSRLSFLWTAIVVVLFLSGYFTTMLGTYVLSLQNSGELSEYFYSNLSLSVIPMSIAAFILLREWGLRLQRSTAESALIHRLITLASSASFGIYLVHMIVLELLTTGVLGFALGPTIFHPLLTIPFTSVIVFLGSFALSLLIQASKWTRWIIP